MQETLIVCFKTPKAPAVAEAPRRADVQGEVGDMRKKLTDQQGVYGQLYGDKGALGDSSYGKSAVKLAKLGA